MFAVYHYWIQLKKKSVRIKNGRVLTTVHVAVKLRIWAIEAFVFRNSISFLFCYNYTYHIYKVPCLLIGINGSCFTSTSAVERSFGRLALNTQRNAGVLTVKLTQPRGREFGTIALSWKVLIRRMSKLQDQCEWNWSGVILMRFSRSPSQ